MFAALEPRCVIVFAIGAESLDTSAVNTSFMRIDRRASTAGVFADVNIGIR
jgi:hypothetical protein